MEIINKSNFDVLISGSDSTASCYRYCDLDIWQSDGASNIYLKVFENLILIKKVTEFCNKIIIKDSLIENEVEIEIIKQG